MIKNTQVDRRSFLSASAALGAMALASTCPAWPQANRDPLPKEGKIPTPDTQMKFNRDGSRRPFRGNTVICHLQPEGAIRNAVNEIHRSLAKASFTSKIVLLPTTSYHMTIYPGVNDLGRDITGWPTGLEPGATIEECTRFVGERMKRLRLECTLPLRMVVDASKTVSNLRASSLRMTAASARDEANIRGIRDRLVDVFGYRDKNHDGYSFHVTLAYQLASFTQEEQLEHKSILTKHMPMIEAAGPVFEFGNPEFCVFPDMFAYDVLQLIST